MFKKLLIFIIFIAILFLLVGFFLPAKVHVERTAVIDRPMNTVHALLNNLGRFNDWSPWAVKDPNAKFTYSERLIGEGAEQCWEGDPKTLGRGCQRIVAVEPHKISFELDFIDQGKADAYYQLRPVDNGTELTWSFDSQLGEDQSVLQGIVSRYFGLFMDRWLGTDYEQGLKRFKAYAETFPNIDVQGMEVTQIEAVPVDILYVANQTSLEHADIQRALAASFGEITSFMADNSIEFAGAPLSITHSYDDSGYRFDAAIPVRMQEVELSGNVQLGHSPAGPALRYVHVGPYTNLEDSFNRFEAWMTLHGYEAGEISWEEYISDPSNVTENELVTHIYYQIK